MGKGGGGSTTTNTVATPWEGQQPYLTDVFNQSNQLYNSGQLAPSYYQGQTVADQSGATLNAMQMQEQRALAGDDQYGSIASAAGSVNGLLNAGMQGNTGLNNLNSYSNMYLNSGNSGLNYLNSYTNSNPLSGDTGYNQMAQMSGSDGTNNAAQSSLMNYQSTLGQNNGYQQMNAMSGQNPANNSAQQALMDYQGALNGNGSQGVLDSAAANAMSGNGALSALQSMTSAVNPYSQELLDQGIKQQNQTLDSTYSSAGRYGSGAHENAKASAATNLTNQFLSNAYDQQMNAANNLSNAYNTTLGTQINAANSAVGNTLQDQSNMLNAQQSAAQNELSAYQNQLNAAQSASQTFNQDQSNILQAQQQAASNALQGYQNQLSAAQGASNTYMQNQSNLLNAAQQAGSLYNTGWGNQIAAANDAASQYSNTANSLNSLAGTAQNIAQQPYTDAAALSEVGSARDAYQQALIDADIDRYNYEQQRPLTALSNYNQLIQGTYGGTSTSTGKQDYTSSTLGNVVGAGSTALGAASMLKDSGLLDYFSS